MPLGISPHSPQKSCSNFSTFVFLLEYKYNLNADDDAMLSKKFHQLLLETKKDCFRFHSQKLSEHQKLDLPSKKARFWDNKKNKHTTTVVSWDVCCCYMVTHPDVMSVPKRNWPCSFHDKWKSLFSKKSVPFSGSKLRICPPAAI